MLMLSEWEGRTPLGRVYIAAEAADAVSPLPAARYWRSVPLGFASGRLRRMPLVPMVTA